jgi:hypothetical protein
MATTKKASALEPLPENNEQATPVGPVGTTTEPTVEEEALPTVDPGQVGHFSRDFKRG